MVESDRLRRLRWRLRGAWQWPVFAVLTVVDAVLITQLPFQGDGPNALGAAWVATAANLFAVALLAPPAGALVRRFRRDLPWVIARDYAGTGLLVLTSFVLLAGGLIHRSAVLDERADQRAMVSAVHDYVLTSEPKYARGLEQHRRDAARARALPRLRLRHRAASRSACSSTPTRPRPASSATPPATRTPRSHV